MEEYAINNSKTVLYRFFVLYNQFKLVFLPPLQSNSIFQACPQINFQQVKQY